MTSEDATSTAHTTDSGLTVTESPGPGVDSIICTVRVPADASSVGKIRKEIVADLDKRDLPEELVGEAEIVASELLTNAVRHARPLSDGTLRVRWKIRADVVEIEVTDGGGATVPRPAPRTVWIDARPNGSSTLRRSRRM